MHRNKPERGLLIPVSYVHPSNYDIAKCNPSFMSWKVIVVMYVVAENIKIVFNIYLLILGT